MPSDEELLLSENVLISPLFLKYRFSTIIFLLGTFLFQYFEHIILLSSKISAEKSTTVFLGAPWGFLDESFFSCCFQNFLFNLWQFTYNAYIKPINILGASWTWMSTSLLVFVSISLYRLPALFFFLFSLWESHNVCMDSLIVSRSALDSLLSFFYYFFFFLLLWEHNFKLPLFLLVVPSAQSCLFLKTFSECLNLVIIFFSYSISVWVFKKKFLSHCWNFMLFMYSFPVFVEVSICVPL